MVESWYNLETMVFKPETIQLAKKLGIKLGFGVLGFTAAFIAVHITDFQVNPVVAAAIAALLHDVAEWANTKSQFTARVAQAYRVATGRN